MSEIRDSKGEMVLRLVLLLILSPEEAELVTERFEECLIGFTGIGATIPGCREREEGLLIGNMFPSGN